MFILTLVGCRDIGIDVDDFRQTYVVTILRLRRLGWSQRLEIIKYLICHYFVMFLSFAIAACTCWVVIFFVILVTKHFRKVLLSFIF